MNTTKCILAVAAIFLVGNGCADEVDPNRETTELEIIGGFRASGKSLNAVGTVGMMGPDGRYSYFCSATLIAPKLVLTAKHCAMVLEGPMKDMKLVNLTPVFFAVGPDASMPIKTVEAIAADLSPIESGGSLGLGSDVAIYHLAEPITDVIPLPLAQAGFSQEDIGNRYLGIGYGAKDILQDLFGIGPTERRAGYMTLRALAGKPAQTIWPTFQDLVDQVKLMVGEENIAFVIPQLVEIYEAEFLPGYEAWVGLDSNQAGQGGSADAQSCHGDSGGPLVGLGANKGIHGVVSGGYFSRQLTCDHGTFYATLGPAVREMITQGLAYTDPCAGVTTKGTCTETVATRCTDKFEGDRRLARVDCADLGMVCRRGPDEVADCFDEAAPAMSPPPAPPSRPMAPTIKQMRDQVQAVRMSTLSPAR